MEVFEFHGWVTIQESVDDTDYDKLHRVVDQIRGKLAPLADASGLLDLRWVNGMPQLHFAGYLNHRCTEGQKMIDLLSYAAKVAPGSYGLLYLHDDEDWPENHNKFRVLTLRRGDVTEHSDQLLSPVVPTIMDS